MSNFPRKIKQQEKNEKRSLRPQMSNFPCKIKCESKKGHYVRRCPIFRAKSSEEQKKVINHGRRCQIFHSKSSEEQKKGHFSMQKQVKSKKKVITPTKKSKK